MNELKGFSIIRFGFVSELDYATGKARVFIREDGITTHFLPVLTAGAKGDKSYNMPAINDQVVLLLDMDMARGIVLGSMFTNDNAPTGFSQNTSGKIYTDGTKDTYDKTAGRRTLHAKNKLDIKTDTETLKAVLADLSGKVKALSDEIQLLTVNAAGVPTTTPINAPNFVILSTQIGLITTRINFFLG